MMMDEHKLSIAHIKVEIPEQKWISDISKNYPDVEIEGVSLLPFDFEKSIGNAIIEINHYKINKIIEDIKTHPSVFEFNIINQVGNRIRINVKTKNQFYLYALIKCGVLIDFPVKIKDGFVTWKLTSTRKRIDDLLRLFEVKGITFSLLRIGNSSHSSDNDKNKLTIEESKILNTAIESGFFEVPRKISLQALANKIGKSKSWSSEILRKIIKKKIEFET